jgi:hypothetical protein
LVLFIRRESRETMLISVCLGYLHLLQVKLSTYCTYNFLLNAENEHIVTVLCLRLNAVCSTII